MKNERSEQISGLIRVKGINAKGFGTIPKAAAMDTRLPVCAKAVYAYLSSFCGGGDTAFPGVSRILRDLNISKGFYYKNINALKEYGYVVVSRERRNGKFVKNVYTLAMYPGAEGPEPAGAEENTGSEPIAALIRAEGINAKGFGTIPKAVMMDTRLSVCAKAVYAYLSSFCGAGKTAFPGIDKIVHDLNISRNYLHKNMAALKEYGYVIVSQDRKKGKFLRNVYTLAMYPGSDVPPEPDKKTRPDAGEKPRKTEKENRPEPRTLPRDTGVLPDTAARDMTNGDSNINRENINTDISYPVSHSTEVYRDEPDGWDGYISKIKENIEYDLIVTETTEKEIDSIVRLISDTLMSGVKTYRINGANIPAEHVKKRLLELDSFDVSYILNRDDPPEEIRNIKAYMLAVIYNAPVYSEFYWKSETRRVQREYMRRKEEKERERAMRRCLDEMEGAAAG